MQTSVQNAGVPAPAQAPVAVQAGTPQSVTVPATDGKLQTLAIPQTREQIEELRTQRNELSEQLSNVSERRSSLAAEIPAARDETSRQGLQERVRLLDQRILQIESDLGIIGRQISSAPAALMEGFEGENQPQGGDQFDEGVMVGGGFVFVALAIAFFFVRRRWKRAGRPAAPQIQIESSQRLERLEQGMEAIAIEIERVAEGQRFVTKLLSESQQPMGVSHRIAKAPVATKRDTPTS